MRNHSYYMRIKLWKKPWIEHDMVAPINKDMQDTPGAASSSSARTVELKLLPEPKGPVAIGVE
eukprot:300362-Heterocapsa_arctica.AAC.1